MFIRGNMLLSHLDDPSISPSNCYLNTFNFFWVSFHCSLHCVCTETCAPETGGRWTWWSRIGWKEGKESGDGGRTTRSTRMCVAPDGKEISGIWGRCWSRFRNTIRRWGEGQVGQMLEKSGRMSMLTGRWTLLMDFCFFRWSRQAACNGDSRAPRLSLELKRVILTTLPHSHSLMLSLFSYHRKTWHQFVKTHILLIFFIFCAI